MDELPVPIHHETLGGSKDQHGGLVGDLREGAGQVIHALP